MKFVLDNRFNKPFIRMMIGILLLLQLSSCSNSEPKQRSAFILFLQTEVINKARVTLPPLTPEQVKDFGDYSKQYELLVNFNEQMKKAFIPLEQSIQAIQTMNTIEQLIKNRDKLVNAQESIKVAEKELSRIMLEVEQQYNQLEQPSDLKSVYKKAYDKVVTNELNIARQALPMLNRLYQSAEKLVDFVQSKGNDVVVTDTTIEFSEQKDVEMFNSLNKEMQDADRAYREFAQKNR